MSGARDVERVGEYALCLIELTSDNSAIASTHIRRDKPLKVISVVGTSDQGEKIDLLEIGVSRGNPWGGMHQRRIRPRKRHVLQMLTHPVIVGIMRAIHDIATMYMADWAEQPTFSKHQVVMKSGKYRWYSNWVFYRGIRFAFDKRDSSLIEFLRWHEARHNRELRHYLTYRARGLLKRMYRWRNNPRWENGNLRKNAECVLNYFKQSKTLRDPYIFSQLLEIMYGSAAITSASSALVQFLMDEKVVGDEFVHVVNASPPANDIPQLNIAARFCKERENGALVWQIYPTDMPPRPGTATVYPEDEEEIPF